MSTNTAEAVCSRCENTARAWGLALLDLWASGARGYVGSQKDGRDRSSLQGVRRNDRLRSTTTSPGLCLLR